MKRMLCLVVRRAEAGQILVIVAFALVGVVGAAALGVDISSDYGSAQRLQQAADAAALAGARYLPETSASGDCTTMPADPAGAAVCDSIATNLGASNLSKIQVVWTPNFRGNSNWLEVQVTGDSPAYFSRIFGLTSATITRKAAASNAAVGGSHEALFANSSSCSSPGVDFEGNSPEIAGAIVSNGGLTDNAAGHGHIEGALYGGPSNCSYSTRGKTDWDTTPIDTSPTLYPWPIVWSSPPPCDFTISGNVTLNSSSASGTYCVSGTITISNNTTLAATLKASKFVFGQHMTLTPAADSPTAPGDPSLGLLIWYTGTSAFDLSPNNSTLTGAVYVPNADMTLGGNSAITGFMEAQNITIQGNSFTMTGTGPLTPGTEHAVALIE